MFIQRSWSTARKRPHAVFLRVVSFPLEHVKPLCVWDHVRDKNSSYRGFFENLQRNYKIRQASFGWQKVWITDKTIQPP
ncbi:hypothetical protein Y1Q_0018401 [Alligator mississippiensis]|uniref:Uncharacterized protein n=1 Tax=Alligator mississippiensis TaxID=8496 RepID=A0A151PC03_ALLMI|nr:hypothetical protein Y1Q_0018401 [Alligator mississippiensis]